MKILNLQNGDSLIEMVLVIAILGILAVAASPQFLDVDTQASNEPHGEIAAVVNNGIALKSYGIFVSEGTNTYPAKLDNASDGSCASGNPCFTNVLKQGILSGWTKKGNLYTHEETGTVLIYSPETGSFR